MIQTYAERWVGAQALIQTRNTARAAKAPPTAPPPGVQVPAPPPYVPPVRSKLLLPSFCPVSRTATPAFRTVQPPPIALVRVHRDTQTGHTFVLTAGAGLRMCCTPTSPSASLFVLRLPFIHVRFVVLCCAVLCCVVLCCVVLCCVVLCCAHSRSGSGGCRG